jgi:hypothetical protein
MSIRAFDSKWVLTEVTYAAQIRLQTGAPTLIPLLLESCRLPSELHSIAYADFRYGYEDGLDRLLRAAGSPFRQSLLEGLLSESDSAIRASWASLSEEQRTWCLTELIRILNTKSSPLAAAAITALLQVAPARLESRLSELLIGNDRANSTRTRSR